MSNDKVLLIAGHGGNDPGATGLISKGEYRYVKEDLFPAMKKYAPKNFVFHDAYNVYQRGNIVKLAKDLGPNTKVVEVHFDASSNANARGGHVIVFSQYAPDALDLRLRDAIDHMVGVRTSYNHRRELGISGRHGLANVNRTASGGVNYRLIELGFGTNRHDADILVGSVDKYAKVLVEAIVGKAVPSIPKPYPKPSVSKPVKKDSAEKVAQDIAAGRNVWGNNPERARKLKVAGYDAAWVQRRINDILRPKSASKPKPKPKKKPVLKSSAEVAREILAGRGGWGNNPERARRLRKAGYDPAKVQGLVNSGGRSSLDVDGLARQVIKGIDDRGRRVPTGVISRAKHFGIPVSGMRRVQNRVNELLR